MPRGGRSASSPKCCAGRASAAPHSASARQTDLVSTDLCLYEVRDGVAVVTFNRPERNNGMTGALELAYFARLAEANDDRNARAIVVTGAGRSFCPGADLGHRPEPGDEPLPNTKIATTFPLT